MIIGVTATGSLARAESAFLVISAVFYDNLGHFSGWGAKLCPENPLLSPKILTDDQKVSFGIFLTFFANSCRFCGPGATLWSWNSLLSPKSLTYSGSFNCHHPRWLRRALQRTITMLVACVKPPSQAATAPQNRPSLSYPFITLRLPHHAMRSLTCIFEPN